ncbi:MAG TPA: cadherin-like domain-containing protein, partial [Nitrospira sp.]|nr:cadherin-like domain-containing protein [Nitrospira sp.]
LLNYEAATSHPVTVRVTDSGGLTYDQSFTIQLTDVNEASTGADGTVTINEDTSHTLTTADFGFSDVDAGDSLSAVRIESLPSAGSLTLSGVAVTAGQVITAADLNAGQLVFTPAADASGVGYASLTFTVRDSGNLYAAGPNTLTVDVTPVNDTPVVSANTGATLAEGGTHTIDSGELALTDVDNSAAQLTYSIGTGPTHGCLELVSAPGLAVATFTQADIAANRLVYVHDGSESISDSFTFTVSDGAGGSLGATTVTLTITPVNDAPTIVSDGGGSTAAITVSEHVSAVTIVSGHDVDLPAQALTYSISGGADQALFTIDAATGALRFVAPSNFTAALSASGDHVYVVQVQVVDSQGASATQTLQVTVANVPVTRTVPVLPPSLVPATPSSAPVPPPAVGPGLPVVAGPVVEPGVRPAPADPMPVREVVGPAAQGSIGREGVKTDDLRRPAEWGLRDEPQGRASDQSERVLPVTLSIEPSRLNSEEGRLSPAVLSELLFAKLDAVIEGLEEAVAAETAQQAQVTRIAAASGVTLSVGFVVWALRSTALLASLFATVPAWQMLDPLPVVASHRRERTLRKRAQEQVAREEQVQYRGLHNLLDEQDAKARRSPDA